MNYAKRLYHSLMVAAGLVGSGSALAVNDSVGGPAVRQLNFHDPVTSIAADIYQLHNWMMGICLVIFLGVLLS